MTESDRQLPTSDAPVRLEIAPAGRLDDARRQRRCWRIAVPAAGAALGVEMVAQRLLVETRLRPAGLVGIDRPEAQRVRRHHLVDQDDLAISIAAEFELGIGNDETIV